MPVEKIEFQTKISDKKHFDTIIIGSGMGALTSACLLAKDGFSVLVLEQNYLPGGCTSSYWRKGYVFETGATTLVGLDENMPLWYLLEKTGVSIEVKTLDLPMQVYLKSGKILHKYKNLDAWITEAESVFGKKNQRKFWEFCYKISNFVWETSLKQTAFPPTRFSDLITSATRANIAQFRYAGYSLLSTEWLLKKFDLLDNQEFVAYVNEQLLITAQNHMEEVNVLFGATALCYTNFGNYYVPGGLLNLVSPLIDFLEKKGSELHLKEEVKEITSLKPELDEKNPVMHRYQSLYQVKTNKDTYTSDFVISGIPINNTLQIYDNGFQEKYKSKILKSEQVNSAFQMGIVFRRTKAFECLHHQIHLPEPLPNTGSASIFVSLSHPEDTLRCDANEVIASVSTHVKNPEKNMVFDKKVTEDFILEQLEKLDFFLKEDVLYYHASHPQAWEKWTKRAWGFVGGYPQYMHTKPWQMLDARLDGKKAYICGDTVYPGQGIPGTVLSGIIAYEKLISDWHPKKMLIPKAP
ncbi:MAG: FAD-dependent oxidoreductase [Verrucomicrobia bacterium]|nr:FAD-dependent oxidoreductase [Cytophagales bacterium]